MTEFSNNRAGTGIGVFMGALTNLRDTQRERAEKNLSAC